MSTEKKGKRVKLTDTEKHLAESKFREGYLWGVERAVEKLERYTGYSGKELFEALVERSVITQDEYDNIARKYGDE